MLTGEQYLASLDDDRATYFEGRRIKDLLAEPAFATPARSIAAGYDRCYSPEPGATNPLVLAPRSLHLDGSLLNQFGDLEHDLVGERDT